MVQLKTLLNDENVRGVVRSADGNIKLFHNKGIIDLFTLLTDNPTFLQNAVIADRVIGRGAALLLIKGAVKKVFAYIMSEPAAEVLRQAKIEVEYIKLQPYIINRSGDGICPVEQLTINITNPDEAYQLIKNFLQK